jgi:hypothetical protein
MRASPFTYNFMLLFSGPIIWAIHFLVIYGFIGVLCARPPVTTTWFGIGIAVWVISAASLIALAAMAALCLWAKPREAVEDNHAFVRWMSITLSLLSALGIIWETLAAYLVPTCA